MQISLLLLLFLFLAAKPAQAYLDPGTGSYLFQLLIGGLLGGLFIFKQYWQAIISAVFRRDKKPHDEPESKKV